MKVYDAASIRNVAVVGHGGSGKTQLISALLFASGMVNRLGKVDEGNTVTDYDEEEIARKHTLPPASPTSSGTSRRSTSSILPGSAIFSATRARRCEWPKVRFWSSTPWRASRCRQRKAWNAAEELELPRIVALNRLDRERASLERSLESLRQSCGRAVIPIQLPIGEEKSFKGVVDLVGLKAYTFATDGSGKMTEGAVPADMADAVTSAREALVEMVAEADEQLMEKFFDAGTLTQDELVSGLKQAVHRAKIFPLVCTSGMDNIGIQPLLDMLVAYVPSPVDRPFKATDSAGAAIEGKADEKGPYGAFVWKTVADQFAGRITMFRVYQGSLKSDTTVQNATQGISERLGHLVQMQGKTQAPVPEIKAGDIGAVAKLKDTRTNDTIAEKAANLRFAPLCVPGSGAVVRHRTEESRRRGQDQHVDAPPRRGRPDHQVRTRSTDARPAARGPGAAAHRSHGRETEASLRRRSAAQAATDSVSRNHYCQGRRAWATQEADRRPRSVW